jgi:hypothetical protein
MRCRDKRDVLFSVVLYVAIWALILFMLAGKR